MPHHLPVALLVFAAGLTSAAFPARAQPQMFQQMESMLCDPKNPQYNPTGCEQVRKAPRPANPNQWMEKIPDANTRSRLQDHQMYQDRLKGGRKFAAAPGDNCQKVSAVHESCRQYYGTTYSTYECEVARQQRAQQCGWGSVRREQ